MCFGYLMFMYVSMVMLVHTGTFIGTCFVIGHLFVSVSINCVVVCTLNELVNLCSSACSHNSATRSLCIDLIQNTHKSCIDSAPCPQ